MTEKRTLRRAKADKRAGKSASTQAGEFVREELDHIRHGKHGAKNAKQAIAIGLSKARRAGVKLKAPGKGQSAATKKKATQDTAASRRRRRPSRKRSRATERALERQPRAAASRLALSRQAKSAARRRTKADRSRAARQAARTRKLEAAHGHGKPRKHTIVPKRTVASKGTRARKRKSH